MKTTGATVSGMASLRFMGINSFRTLAGILALFLAAAFADGFGKDAKDEAKPASGETAENEAKPSSGENVQDKPDAGHEDCIKGIAAFEKKDFAEAVKLFRSGAEKGDAEAMVMLSFCLENGKGVEEDQDESMKWGRKAADTGHPLAQAMYGASLLGSDSEKEGIAYLKKSAAQDCIVGQYILGMHYLMETDSKFLKVEGVNCLKKAAGNPLTDERNVLDYAKDDDDEDRMAVFGLPPDITATSLGIIISQFALGSAYMQGNGVKQNFAEARKWLALASDNGLPQAGVLLKQLDDLEKTDAPAALEKSENVSVGEAAGDGPGQEEFRSGLAAYDGKDFAEAVKLFRAGAEKGGAEAQIMLACCLEYGIGIEKDEKEAEKWMKKAADAGNAVAQAVYATRWLKDNREEAVGYLERSAEQGCVCGQLALGSLYLLKDDGASQAIGAAYVMKIAALPLTDEKSIEDYLLNDEDRSTFDRDVSAANGTILLAQYLAGGICLRGFGGVEKDLDEAEKWFRKAADGGLIMAKEAVKTLEARK